MIDDHNQTCSSDEHHIKVLEPSRRDTNGELVEGAKAGALARYSCVNELNYYMTHTASETASTRQCLKDGTWEGSPPRCCREFLDVILRCIL